MADLAPVARMRLIEKRADWTLPAAEVIGPGEPVIADANGKAAPASAANAGTAGVIGVNLSPRITAANMAAHVISDGDVYLEDANGANVLADLDYGAEVFLSDTEGRLADTAGTVSVRIGRVMPLWDQQTPTKVLRITPA